MQNLEIIYEESSAQLEYLEQYSLIEEEQIQRHVFEEISEYCNDFQFKQINVEEKPSPQVVTFDQFLENVLNINEVEWLRSHRKFLKGLLFALVGDVTEYAFNVDDESNKKPLQLLIAYKWTIILHMLTIFLTISLLPFEYTFILLWVSFSFAVRQDILQSEILKSVSYKSSINNLMNQLKHLYLQRNMKTDSYSLKHSLKQFARALQRRYKLPIQQTPFIMDKIQQLLFRVYEGIKRNNYASIFLSSKSAIFRKYYFFMLKFQNKGLKDIEQVLLQIIQQFKDAGQTKISNYMKPLPKKILYISSCIYNLQQLCNQQHFRGIFTIQARNLLKIMRSQVEFKYISKAQRTILGQQFKQGEVDVQSEIDEVSCYIQQPKTQIGSYYLEDNQNVTKYQAEDVEVIKKKLNEIFKEKLEKQQIAEQTNQIAEKHQAQKFEKSIFSFGIPILPPKRDMEAFYLQ